MVVFGGSGDEVGTGPDQKSQGWKVPCHDGKPTPLKQFPKKIGTGNIVEEKSFWDFVTRFIWLTQIY